MSSRRLQERKVKGLRTLLGNAQVPSVTVRLRAKLAPEVARRLESFSACRSGRVRQRRTGTTKRPAEGQLSPPGASSAKRSSCVQVQAGCHVQPGVVLG